MAEKINPYAFRATIFRSYRAAEGLLGWKPDWSAVTSKFGPTADVARKKAEVILPAIKIEDVERLRSENWNYKIAVEPTPEHGPGY